MNGGTSSSCQTTVILHRRIHPPTVRISLHRPVEVRQWIWRMVLIGIDIIILLYGIIYTW